MIYTLVLWVSLTIRSLPSMKISLLSCEWAAILLFARVTVRVVKWCTLLGRGKDRVERPEYRIADFMRCLPLFVNIITLVCYLIEWCCAFGERVVWKVVVALERATLRRNFATPEARQHLLWDRRTTTT